MHHHNHGILAIAITLLGTLPPREASAMSPCGGVQVSALPITTLTWDTINGQPSYRLQIAANANFQWPDLTEVSLDGFYFQIGLQFGTHYYWRLSAGDGVNWGPYGAACDFFTTAGSTAPTGTPNQYSPTDGQAGLGGGAYVSWSSVGAAATYALQYATNASFTGATNLPLTVTATSLSGLASGQTYYWRVRGENGFGGGPWSTTRTFYTTTVATTISSKVFLQGPLVVGTTTLMSDGLRAGGWLPSGEPYSAMGYTLLDNSGASISSAVLATTGNNAPVDWILLEAPARRA